MRTPLFSTLATVLALLAGYGMLQLGNTLQGTLLAVRGGLEGFSATTIGLVGSGFSAGLILGSLRAGKLIRLVGHTRAFAALAAIASTAALLHLMIVHPIVWILVRALTGFCFAGLLIAVESWLNGAASPAIRGQLLSIYGMTGLLAGVFGQLLLPTGNPAGFVLFCMVAMIISLALVPVTLSRATAPLNSGGDAGLDLRRLYRQSPFGLIAAFLCGVSSGAFFSLGPLVAQRMGMSSLGIAIFMASGTLGAFATTWPLGYLSDRIDRRWLIIAMTLVASVTITAMLTLLPENLPDWITYLLVFVFGGVVVPTYSLVTAHVNDCVTPGEFVAASGGLLIVQGTGAATGPILGGFAMSLAGADGLATLILIAQLAIAAWGLYRIRARAAPLDKETFQVMPQTLASTELVSLAQEASVQGEFDFGPALPPAPDAMGTATARP